MSLQRCGSQLTEMVNFFAVGSVSIPPFAVPPLSWTWNVKLEYGVPFEFAAGVNISLPEVMSEFLGRGAEHVRLHSPHVST